MEITHEKLEQASNMLKAIAHPVRIAIIGLLGDEKMMTVSNIRENIGIPQSATSHHLGILKDKGVLCSKRDGKNTYYFLKYPRLSEILDCIGKCTCE